MPLLFDYACLVSWIGPISWLTYHQVMTSNYWQKILPLTACNDTNLAMCFMTIPRKWSGFWILWEGRIDCLRLCIEQSGIWERGPVGIKNAKFVILNLLGANYWQITNGNDTMNPIPNRDYHIWKRGFFLETIPLCLPSVVWNVGSFHGWAADDLREYTRCHYILLDSTISLYNSYSQRCGTLRSIDVSSDRLQFVGKFRWVCIRNDYW